MRAQLEHYKSETIRLEQKTRSLQNEVIYRDNVIAALREAGDETSTEASAAELDALRDFASQSTALAEQRSAQVSELQQDLAAAREQQRVLQSEASAAVRRGGSWPLRTLSSLVDFLIFAGSRSTATACIGLDRPLWLKRARRV